MKVKISGKLFSGNLLLLTASQERLLCFIHPQTAAYLAIVLRRMDDVSARSLYLHLVSCFPRINQDVAGSYVTSELILSFEFKQLLEKE